MHDCPKCFSDCDCEAGVLRCTHLCLQLADAPIPNGSIEKRLLADAAEWEWLLQGNGSADDDDTWVTILLLREAATMIAELKQANACAATENAVWRETVKAQVQIIDALRAGNFELTGRIANALL